MTTPLRVLLVEDCIDDAEFTLRAIRAGGYEPSWRRVDTAAGLAAALDAGPWDVILCDHRMPEFSSAEAMQMVRDRGVDVPLIIVSGTIGEEAAVAVMRAGAQDYILKSNLTRLPVAIERELREAAERRARRDAERARREAEEKYQQLVESIPAITFATTDGLSDTYVSPQIEEILGYSPSEWLGRPDAWVKALHPDDRERVLAELARSRAAGDPWLCDYRMVARDGRVVWLRADGHWTRNASGALCLQGLLVDVTDRKEAEETISHLAYHDPLTDLPNRLFLSEGLARAIEAARRAHRPLALLRLSLVRLPEIRNTLGHDNEDAVVKEVAGRLERLPEADLIARLGPAEFALVSSAKGAEAAVRLAE
jgi:PAS domain S-box-containing protein